MEHPWKFLQEFEPGAYAPGRASRGESSLAVSKREHILQDRGVAKPEGAVGGDH